MAFTLNPETGKIEFGVVADTTHDAIARDIASEFGVSETFNDNFVENTTSFSDDFSSNNWTEDGSGDFTISGGVMNWETDDTTLNHFSFIDMLGQTVSDTNWTLRFKLDVENFAQGSDATNQELYILLGDTTNTATESTQDAIGLRFVVDNTLSEIRMLHADGSDLQAPTTLMTTNISATTWFVEIKRTSATEMTVNLFSDAGYTQLIESASATIPAGITDLRYLRIQNRDGLDGTNDHTFDGTMDDVKFWDNDTPTDWTAIGTGIRVNTISEVIDWNAEPNQANNGTAFDLGTVSDTAWVLRYKMKVNNHTQGAQADAVLLEVGLSDKDETASHSGTTQDFIGMRTIINNLNDEYNIFDVDNALNSATSEDVAFTRTPTTEIIYVEIKRTSATTYEVSQFSDSTYTTLLESESGTCSANTQSLRYIRILNKDNGDGTTDSVFDGTIDDIQFWNGITVPVITSTRWRMRFTLDITALSLTSGSDLSLWIGMYSEDETSDSNNAQDGFHLGVFVDNTLNRFIVGTPDNQAPRASGVDKTMGTAPSEATFFVEMERDSASQTTVRFYTDNTYTSTIESESQAGVSGTDSLKYLKLFNDVLANNANTMDGTFDDFTFTDMTLTLADAEKEFLVDALIQTLGVNGSCFDIFTDDMSNSGNWTATDITPAGFFRISGGVIDFDAVASLGDNDTIALDYQNLSGNTLSNNGGWGVRFTIDLTSYTNGTNAEAIFSMSNVNQNDNQRDDAQDLIGFRLTSTASGSGPEMVGVYANTALTDSPTNLGTNVITVADSVKGFEIERLDSTTARVTAYTDATYSTVLATDTFTIPSTIVGLDFFKAGNGALAGTGNIQGDVNDLNVVDSVGTASGNVACSTVDAVIISLVFTCGDKVIFEDDFTTSANWVQTGTQVTIASGEIQGWGADATAQRVTHDLVTPLSDKGWTVEFEYEFSSFANPAHDILVLTDTNTTSSGLQDHIAVRFGFSGGLIQFGILRGDNSALGSGSILGVTASINTRYFVRLQRISPSLGRLTVFTGAFDSVLFGTVDVDLAGGLGGDITGLRFVISETSDLGGAGRTLTGIIDNLVITNACCNFEVDALLQVTRSLCGISLANLKAYWTFDETSATLVNRATEVGSVDSLGTSADGTDGGSLTQNITGQVDTSYRFNGPTGQVGNTVTIGSSTSQFNFMHTQGSVGTWSFWIFPEDITQVFGDIVLNENNGSGNTGMSISLASGKISVRPRAPVTELLTPTQTTNALTQDVFTMVTVVWDEATGVDVYFNGVFEDHFNRTAGVASSGNANHPMTFGARTDTQAGLGLDGRLDEMTAWDRKLTPDEISKLFALGNGGNQIQAGGAGCFSVDSLVQTLGDNGSCADNYMDDMSVKANWVSSDEGSPGFFRINETTDKLDYDAVPGTGNNDSIVTDLSDPSRLGTLLDDNGGWIIRFTHDLTTYVNGNPNHAIFSASDRDQTGNQGAFGSEDLIGFRFSSTASGAGPSIVGVYRDDTGLTSGIAIGDNNTVTTSTGVQGCEIIRNSATSATVRIYTDATYSTVSAEGTFVIPATITGLKYFKGGNFQFSQSGDGDIKGSLDDLDVTTLGAVGNVGCAQVDAKLIFIQDKEFTVDAFIQSLGDNGTCTTIGNYTDDMSSSTGWVTTDISEMFVSGGVLNWNVLADTTNDTIAIDLADPSRLSGNVSDTDFVLRFKVDWTTVSGLGFFNHVFMGLSDSDETVNGGIGSEDYIGIHGQIGPTGAFVFGLYKDSSASKVQTPSLETPTSGKIRYYEIIRSGTSVTWNTYSDASFTILVNSESLTVPSSVQSLRYFKVGNWLFGNNVNLFNGEVDDLDIASGTGVGNVACPSADAVVKALNTDKEFFVDGIAFVPPAKLFIVQGLIKGTVEEEFFVDSCLRSEPFFNFTVDACIQQNNNDGIFTVDGLAFDFPVRLFLIDSIVRYSQGTTLTGGIPDLIIRVLRENGTLTGRQIVEEIVKITSDPSEGFSFRGKTSRIKNWLTRLTLDNLIQEDGSDPDWYETIWSLV